MCAFQGCAIIVQQSNDGIAAENSESMPVLVNVLENLPHTDGQKVRDVQREDFAVEIAFSSGAYCVYGFVRLPGGGEYTRLAAERKTVAEARELAARLWREGRDFDPIIGSPAKES
jgi:hypothetical protein